MVGNEASINTGNKELNANISVQNQQYIKRELDELEREFNNFNWIVLSIIFGILITILTSFNIYFKIMGIFLFGIIFLILLHVYFNKKSRYLKNKKEYRLHQEKCLGTLYLQGKINDEQMMDYVKRSAVSKERYSFLLNERNRLAPDYAPIIPKKIKITYYNNAEEIYERGIIDIANNRIFIYDLQGVPRGLIPFNDNIKKIEEVK